MTTKINRRRAIKILGVGGWFGLSLGLGALPNSVLAKMEEALADPDFMVFLIYTPRADSEDREYSKWLQDVDNPFFNSVPEIHHYTNWIITDGAAAKFPYTYFDFMVCNDREAFNAAWARQEVLDFAGGWTVDWGQFPDATPETMADNYHVYVCKRLSPAVNPKTKNLDFTPLAESPDLSKAGDSTETWQVTEGLLGTPHFQYFQVRYFDPDTTHSVAKGSVRGKIIASPD